VPINGEMAPQAHPEEKTEEQESYKLREKLVAVTRIVNYVGPKLRVSLGAMTPPVVPVRPRQTASVLVAS